MLPSLLYYFGWDGTPSHIPAPCLYPPPPREEKLLIGWSEPDIHWDIALSENACPWILSCCKKQLWCVSTCRYMRTHLQYKFLAGGFLSQEVSVFKFLNCDSYFWIVLQKVCTSWQPTQYPFSLSPLIIKKLHFGASLVDGVASEMEAEVLSETSRKVLFASSPFSSSKWSLLWWQELQQPSCNLEDGHHALRSGEQGGQMSLGPWKPC